MSAFPKIDITTFLLSISTAALRCLGLDSDDKHDVNLPLARQNIDLLELMQEKTKGNLTAEESKLLEQLLFEVRMRYVDAQRRFPDAK